MIYLILSIFLSCAISVIFKAIEKKDFNGDNVTLFNYVFASTCAFANAYSGGLVQQWGRIAECDLSTLLSEKSVPGTLLLLSVLGLFTGILYLVTLLLIRKSIAQNGMNITALFGKFSFIFTALFSILLWAEIPTAVGFVGLAVAVFGLLLLTEKKNLRTITNFKLLFLLTGFYCLMEMSKKIFVQYGLEEFKDLFVFAIFFSALINCVVYVAFRARKTGFKIRFGEILTGIAVGLPNVLSSTVQLLALQYLPVSVVFPSIAIGSLFVTTIISRFIFREVITRRQLISSTFAFVGIILINL